MSQSHNGGLTSIIYCTAFREREKKEILYFQSAQVCVWVLYTIVWHFSAEEQALWMSVTATASLTFVQLLDSILNYRSILHISALHQNE